MWAAFGLAVLAVAAAVWAIRAMSHPAGRPRTVPPASERTPGARRARDPDLEAATALASMSWCEFPVVGESFSQDALRRIAGSSPTGVSHHCYAVLRRQPDNPHDPNAVAIYIGGHQVAYLAKVDAKGFAARLRKLGVDGPTRCHAYINGGHFDEHRRRRPYGVQLGLEWPAQLSIVISESSRSEV